VDGKYQYMRHSLETTFLFCNASLFQSRNYAKMIVRFSGSNWEVIELPLARDESIRKHTHEVMLNRVGNNFKL
jgi:hypothetical protein